MADLTYCETLAQLAHNPQDHVAWESLWQLVQNRWFSAAYSIMRSADRADDAIQNAMLYIRDHAGDFTAPSTGNAEAACQAWLMRIVCNSALQLKRSDGRHDLRNQDHGAGMHQAQHLDPAESVAHSDLLQVIQQQQNNLSDAHQSCLALFYAADLDYEETAAAMSCTVNNARVRVHRALKALRTLLTRAGISCSVWSISNALSAQEIPLHLSTIEASHFTQLPAESSAVGVLDASLPTGGLSIMAQLTISTAIAASLTLGAFGFNHMFAEESKPAPKQIEHKENKSIASGKHWVQSMLNADIDNLLQHSQTPFILDAKNNLHTEDELRSVFEKIMKGKGHNFPDVSITKATALSSLTREEVEAFINKRSKNTINLPARTEMAEITVSKQGKAGPVQDTILVFIDPETNKCFGFTDF